MQLFHFICLLLVSIITYLLIADVTMPIPQPSCHAYLTRYAEVDTYTSADEIIPNLWLGNECEAFENSINYDIVISMSAEHNLADERLILGNTYFRFPLWDTWGHATSQILEDATFVIDAKLQEGKKILVHCQMGKSRSASAVIAYLLTFHPDFKDKPFHQVWAFVKSKRPIAHPNPHFMSILEEL